MPIQVRRLQEDDAPALWKLRLNGLEAEPHAFAESVEEHRHRSVEEFRRQLFSSGAENFVVGAFDGDALVGMAGFFREQRAKRSHKGGIWGFFVSPEARGNGVGRRLLIKLIEYARSLDGLTCVLLTVAVTQESARQLYRSLGFRCFGIEPRALKIEDHYIGEEHMILEFDEHDPPSSAGSSRQRYNQS